MFDKKVDDTIRRLSATARPRVKIDLKTLDRFECPCGNRVFTKANEVYFLPAISSPNGMKGVIVKEVLRCTSCGKVFDPDTLTS